MKRVYLSIALMCVSLTNASAHILSDEGVQQLVNNVKRVNTLPNMAISRDKRTIVCNIYNVEKDIALGMSPQQLALLHTDDVAALMACNFISQKNIYHYIDQYGNPETRIVSASPFDFLGISNDDYRIQLKDCDNALGVNIEMLRPRGWVEHTAHNSHTVAHFMYGEGENQVSFMIQIIALPMFFSRNETRELFNGNAEFGLTKEDLFENIKGQIIDIRQDIVGGYPAMHIKVKQDAIILGVARPMYTNLWYVIYEDRAIMIWGTVLRPTTFEQDLFDLMFQTMVSTISFPDQFDKKYE